MVKNKATFTVEASGGETVVHLAGEIDHHNAAPLRREIDKMVGETRPDKLVLDVSSIDFMDSSGLGLIMGRYMLIKEQGGEFALRNPTPAVLKICRLAGLERMMTIEKKKAGNKKG